MYAVQIGNKFNVTCVSHALNNACVQVYMHGQHMPVKILLAICSIHVRSTLMTMSEFAFT